MPFEEKSGGQLAYEAFCAEYSKHVNAEVFPFQSLRPIVRQSWEATARGLIVWGYKQIIEEDKREADQYAIDQGFKVPDPS